MRRHLCVLSLVVVAVSILAACTSGVTPGASVAARLRPGGSHRAQSAAQRAAALTVGTGPWRIPWRLHGGIEGFAGRTSVLPGQSVALYVSTPAPSFRVQAFRMGWYGGQQAHQVWLSGPVAGHVQPRAVLLSAATRTYTAPWRPSVTVSTRGWQPGDYLLRLDAATGHESFVPLTVRGTSARGRIVLISAVTTWQAYNLWGCCSLYREAHTASFALRSRAVTFDRPYASGGGAGPFLNDELGIVSEAERLKLPLDYVTDVDLQQNPSILDGARAVVSLGHDEYWSPQMRDVLARALAHGTNLAFFGANAIYRRIRFGSTSVGPDRLEINYKIGRQDPLYGRDNAAVTANWPDHPDPDPESRLIGGQYNCYLGTVPPVAAAVIDPRSWLFADLHVRAGDAVPDLYGPEVDALRPGYPTPGPVTIVLSAPVRCEGGKARWGDTTYATTPSGAGVFDAGTMSWPCALTPACHGPHDPLTTTVVRQVTDNVLQVFAGGPAARQHISISRL